MTGQYEPNVKESEYDLDLTKMRRYFSVQRAKTEKFNKVKRQSTYQDKLARNSVTQKNSPMKNDASPNKFKVYRSVTRRTPMKEGSSPLLSLYFKKREAPNKLC
jgi:hypothetical protein